MTVKRTKRLNALLDRWAPDFTPEALVADFEGSSEKAAIIAEDALRSVLEDVQKNSMTDSLAGYIVRRIPAPKVQVRLKRSGIDLSGDYDWIITVEAPGAHQSMGLHLFDLLDEGRPELKKRDPPLSPYPLWGSGPSKDQLNARIKRGGPGGSAGGRHIGGKNVFTTIDFRQDKDRGKNIKGNIRFSRGPIKAVAPLQLYEAALRRAEDRLSVKGLDKHFDVIFIGSNRNG